MNQRDLLRHGVDTLERLDVPYAIVGSFASGAYGEPRFTQDIDILVDLKPRHVAELCRSFPAPDYYVSMSAAQEAVAQRRQFNVIHTKTANKIDFMLSRSDEWGRNQLARRVQIEVLDDFAAYVASAEDVILAKMSYYNEGGSDKHLRDIAGVLQIQSVDTEYIGRYAEQLRVVEVWKMIQERL